MKEIEQYIQSYFGIGNKDLSSIADMFVQKIIRRNDFLLRTGQHAQSLSFVKTGYLRIFALDAKGEKEITQWITNEGMFVTDLSSLIFHTPSRWNIQALSDCECFSISKEKYNQIGDYIDNWAQLEKLFITKCFVAMEDRIFRQLSMTAEQKVKQLFEMNSKIFNQVPLQYIASMLGITPETLSRIRRKMIS